MPSPAPAGSFLYGVAATSASNAWAVGPARSGKPVILHWNGTTWKQVPSPSPGAFAGLSSVAATSASNAWAVGDGQQRQDTDPALERHRLEAGAQPEPGRRGPHRRGRVLRPQRLGGRYSRQRDQQQGPDPALERHHLEAGAQPGPGEQHCSTAWPRPRAGSAWAVGFSGTSDRALIEQWNGTTWKTVPSPSPTGSGLVSVAATSASNAWAVGGIGGPQDPDRAVERHHLEDGAQPQPRTQHPLRRGRHLREQRLGGRLRRRGQTTKTLILRWNGTSWTRS